MSSATTYTDISELRNAGLDENFVVESDDFFENAPQPVGVYVSPSRTITRINKKDDGSVVFELTFGSGLLTPDGSRSYGVGSKYPIKTYISTKLFALPDKPGLTSSASQYLTRCGFNTKGMTIGDFINAVGESVNLPVGVRIDWENRTEKDAATGQYPKPTMKSKDFITGTDAEGNPTYSPQVTVNGTTFTARARVNGFRAVQQ